MKLKEIREMYPEGTQIVLTEMAGESQMPYGLKGTVKFVDDAGQIHMSWENGSSLALNINEDTFEKVEAPEKISVILVEPGRYPKLIEIEDTLEAMQSLVEGDIEEYMPFEDEVACSLRMGEMLGLTWDCIDISEESLKENNASIFVDKELQRVNRDVMEVLDNKDIIRVFPRTLSNTNTSLVLKTPKTKTSVRKIFLPSTVAQMLLERKKQIDEMKELFGDEYLDYDLVFCHSSGRPMEGQVINRALKKLIQDNDLPDVVFHSFRHASITYKLKWNGGDMKSVQGDSGHARMDMVADVYSHIIDEDRRYNAQKFEEQFYNAKGLKNAEEGKTAPMPKFETSVELLDPMAEVQKGSEVEEEKPAENSADENAALLAKLLSNPDTAALLKALAKTI